MSAFKDLSGQTKGDWTVKHRVQPPDDTKVKNRPWYLLECKSGHQKIARGQDVAGNKILCCRECLAIARQIRENEKFKNRKTRKQISALIADRYRQNRVGEENMSNDGTLMRIVEYHDSQNVIVEFQDEFKYRVNVEYSRFKKGTIKNPYKKLLYGRGYIGDGPYEQSVGRIATREYDMWRRMFDRCYSGKQPAYNDCDVCEEWWDFQNFAKWYREHYYEIPGQVMQVDKDWLHIGNRLYCPERCCIAPHLINSCLLTHHKTTYSELPTGILRTASNRFKARCSIEGKRKDLGTYDTVSEAFEAYKKCKIQYVESLAQKFKDYIPQDLFDAVRDYHNTFNERGKYTNETVC